MWIGFTASRKPRRKYDDDLPFRDSFQMDLNKDTYPWSNGEPPSFDIEERDNSLTYDHQDPFPLYRDPLPRIQPRMRKSMQRTDDDCSYRQDPLPA